MSEAHAPDASAQPQAPLRALRAGAAKRWQRLRGDETGPHAFRQLRRRLVATSMVATTLVLLIVSIAIYFFETGLELAQVDRQLTREANSKVAEGMPATIIPPDPTETAYDPKSSNFFSIVVAPGGIIAQDDDQAHNYNLPDWNQVGVVITGMRATSVTTATHGGYEFRLYTTPIKENGVIVGVVQSGISLDVYHQQQQDLLHVLIALDGIIALVTFFSSVYMTDRALKPARAAFERQRQFAAGASHELRTPLAVIRSLAELLADHRCPPAAEAPPSPTASASVEGPESITSDAEEIIHEVDYMTRLVTDLLLLARDEQDRRALNWVVVDMRRVLLGVVEKVEPLAAMRNIALTSDLTSTADGKVNGGIPALVEGDPDRLRELALILLENAVRYTPRGGSVIVTLNVTRGAVIRGERHGHVTFAVRDTGVGIAPEDQAHVFEPFYRATSSTLRRASATETKGESSAGSGLGLALAHWIVEAHRGKISLSSQPGVGTTFTIELPLLAQPRTTYPPELTPHASQPA